MAYDFVAASSQYLENSTTPLITAVPLTLACWMNGDDVANPGELLAIGGESGATGHEFILRVNTSNLWALTNAGTAAWATGTTTLSNGTWYHACAVFASSTSRSIYTNGTDKQTNTTSKVPSAAFIERTRIGRRVADDAFTAYYDGQIAECCVWNVALTDAEVASLATGISPLLIRPGNLTHYWPLIRGLQDHINVYDMTVNGGASVATHPAIRYVPHQTITTPGSAAAGGTVPPLAMNYYRRRRAV